MNKTSIELSNGTTLLVGMAIEEAENVLGTAREGAFVALTDTRDGRLKLVNPRQVALLSRADETPALRTRPATPTL